MQTLAFELHFKGKVYKLSQAPTNYTELLQMITQTLNDKFLSLKSIQYEDIEGDHIMLTSDDDFQALVKDFENSTQSVAIFVNPILEEEIPASDQSSRNEIIEDANSKSDESFNILEEGQSAKKEKQKVSTSHDIINLKDSNEEEISFDKLESEKEVKNSEELLANMVKLPGDIQDKIKEFLCPAKMETVEQSSQTEQKEVRTPVDLMESSAQTLNNELKEPTENKITQTNSQVLGNQDKGLQFDYDICLNDKDNSLLEAEKSESFIASPVKSFREVPTTNQEEKAKKDESEQNNLEELIFKAVSANLPKVASLVKDYLETSEREERKEEPRKLEREGKPIHANCICDGCGVSPVLGVRYRCAICEDFDFCEKCEATKDHPHLFYKIKSLEDYKKLPIGSGEPQKDFNLKDIGRKLKETTLAKVVFNIYGQIFNKNNDYEISTEPHSEDHRNY